ncbi:class I SAM-dependent methyltransferase [Streptomyces sp. NPDC059866]|uniref:class I SAM-dependent methyltransferase n=1 Tax=Streptomyces sp. NPDC059866 TaxID=3346978 RepID=UPI003661192A
MERRTANGSSREEAEMTVTGRKELQHPRFARQYLKLAEQSDRRGGAEHRHRLLAGLSGRVLEIGAGQGRNFPHYPDTVTEVVALEPDDTLRAVAEQQAASAPVRVTVVAGEAAQLPGKGGEFDAVVASLVLCSVGDLAGALEEMARVLRPGGELRFYEHVRSPRAWVGLLEDAITPLWSRAGGGCHPNRDTEAAIRAAGFAVTDSDSFGFSPSPFIPKVRHVLGSAVRP